MPVRYIAMFAAPLLLTVSGPNEASAGPPVREVEAPRLVATLPALALLLPNDDKGGLEALQGTWLLVAYGGKGEAVKPEINDKQPWVIKGNRFSYYQNSERNDVKLAADLKVDPGKKPGHIDFGIKGKWKGKEMEWTTYGIYSVQGDELTVCVPEKFDPWEPENRPKEFKSTKPAPEKGSGFVVYVLKRKK